MDVEQIIREYITKSLHMSLGTSRDNMPWVCEVHFAYDEQLNLYFRSLPDRRHCLEIADNPNVAGNIVKQHAIDELPHGIYFEGTAQQMTDDSERQVVFPLFQVQQAKEARILDEARKLGGAQFYKIIVKNWYAFGKFGGSEMKKHTLEWNGGQQTAQTQS